MQASTKHASIRIHMHVHNDTCMSLQANIHASIHSSSHSPIHPSIYPSILSSVQTYIRTYVNTYVLTYTHMHIHPYTCRNLIPVSPGKSRSLTKAKASNPSKDHRLNARNVSTSTSATGKNRGEEERAPISPIVGVFKYNHRSDDFEFGECTENLQFQRHPVFKKHVVLECRLDDELKISAYDINTLPAQDSDRYASLTCVRV